MCNSNHQPDLSMSCNLRTAQEMLGIKVNNPHIACKNKGNPKVPVIIVSAKPTTIPAINKNSWKNQNSDLEDLLLKLK